MVLQYSFEKKKRDVLEAMHMYIQNANEKYLLFCLRVVQAEISAQKVNLIKRVIQLILYIH